MKEYALSMLRFRQKKKYHFLNYELCGIIGTHCMETSMLELSDEIRMAESKPILEIGNGKQGKDKVRSFRDED